MVGLFTSSLDSVLSLQKALSDAMAADWFGSGLSSRGAFPPINVFEADGDYVITAELPGVPRSAIEVDIQRNRVRISGAKQANYDDAVSLHRRERRSGAFDRTFSIPFEIDAEQAKAEYRDGILTLSLPRAERDKPRPISIS